MKRISSDMPTTDMQYRLRRQEENLAKTQSKLGTGTRIKELRDDPMGAAHAVRYDSYLTRLQQYEKLTSFAGQREVVVRRMYKELKGNLQ